MTPFEAENNAYTNVIQAGEFFERDYNLEPLGFNQETRVNILNFAEQEVNQAFEAMVSTLITRSGQEISVETHPVTESIETVGRAVLSTDTQKTETEEPSESEIVISKDGVLSVEAATKAVYAAHDDAANTQASSFSVDNDQFVVAG